MEDFMERREFEERPEDLERVADWLRAQRPEVSALELDRIKQRARAQAMRGERTGAGVERPRRSLATIFTVILLTVSLGGALALAGQGPPFSSNSGSSHGSAAKKQYCPPKGDDDDDDDDHKKGHHKKGKKGKKGHGHNGKKCKPPKPPKPPHDD